MKNPFPEFVNNLPKKDYGIEGLEVHSDLSERSITCVAFAAI